MVLGFIRRGGCRDSIFGFNSVGNACRLRSKRPGVEYQKMLFPRRLVAITLCGGFACLNLPAPAIAGPSEAAASQEQTVIEQRVIDAAMQKLHEKKKQRVASPAPQAPPGTQPPATQPWSTSLTDPYGVQAVTARKLQLLRIYDAQIAGARAALRRHTLSAREVRQLVDERAALLQLPLEKLRWLMMETDRLNSERLGRYRDAFGELVTAGKTVTVILMKSGLIDFATPLPEDPLTVEIEQSRGVRRAYYQFYLSPKDAAPRRYNGYVEFAYDNARGLWVPTWTDFSGQPVPLFDAEAFIPLRPYDIFYTGSAFAVAQMKSIRPPELFTLLMPRWAFDGMMPGATRR
jgi:hypothetical protein